MHHRRLPSFSCQRIHITRSDRKSCLFFGFSADPFHICSKKRIHAGNADHHNRRLLLQTVTDLLYSLWHFFQMSSRYDIGLIHRKIKEPILILRHGTDHGRIPSAASRCHDQHDRIRDRKARSLYTESFRSRRIKCKRRRRTVDQMCIRPELFRNVISSPLL